jgi:hypothetical protein
MNNSFASLIGIGLALLGACTTGPMQVFNSHTGQWEAAPTPTPTPAPASTVPPVRYSEEVIPCTPLEGEEPLGPACPEPLNPESEPDSGSSR